jgi:high-affinity K+ transport system ATPase subunit B
VQIRNPVMFVVEIGAVITTVTWFIQFGGGQSAAATSPRGTRSRSRSGCG